MSETQPKSATTGAPDPALTRRRFLALGAAGAAGAALVAASPSVASAAVRSGVRNVREPEAKTTLSFLSWDTIPVIKPIVDLFEKQNPSISIEISHLQGPNHTSPSWPHACSQVLGPTSLSTQSRTRPSSTSTIMFTTSATSPLSA